MMNFRSKIKQGLMATFAFALIFGATVKAHAIQVTPNDLVLVLWGNGTEYYQVVGRTPAADTTPGVYNISGTGVSAAGPAATTKWTLISMNFNTGDFSGDPTTSTFTFRGASVPSTVTAADQIFNNMLGWSGNLPSGPNATSATLPTSDSGSFFQAMDGSEGSGRLAGVLPSGTSAAGSYGQTLTILAGDFNTGNITNPGTMATLSLINPSDLAAGAILAITAPSVVPLPPAVVLFASGLVGLIGVARRRLIAA